MRIQLDYTKIKDILNHFSNATNLNASYQFENSELQTQFVDDENGEHMIVGTNFDNSHNHFCHYIHDSLTTSGCLQCDNYYKEKAKAERRTIVYSCFAGICESITPVILGDIIVGYVIVGKFIDESRVYSNEQKIVEFAKQNDLDTDKLIEFYNMLPVISIKQMESAIVLLKLCISYILNQEIIKLRGENVLDDIQSYIIDNVSSNITVKDICSKFFINRQKLYLLFKTKLNVSVKEYITSLRIERAKQLLSEDDKTLDVIAEETGFSDYNYFIRVFKKNVGISPLKYRKNTAALKQQNKKH